MKTSLVDCPIVVTGGFGFFGGWIASELLRRGARVSVTSHLGNTRRVPFDPQQVRVIPTDLLDPYQAQSTIHGHTIVIHAAALDGGINFKRQFPAQTMYVNTVMTMNTLDAAVNDPKIEKVVYISSAEVYSDEVPTPMLEEDGFVGDPAGNTGYAWSKRFCEKAAAFFVQERSSIASLIVRPTNLYGPFDKTDPTSGRVIPIWVQRALSGQPLEIFGNAETVRSFLYVRDAARALTDLLEPGATPDTTRVITLNLSGSAITLRELAQTILQLTGSISPITVIEDGSAPKRRVLSDEFATRLFPFRELTSLPDGLRKTISWARV